MKNEFLIEIIKLLEVNQKFPKYQLERRIDILFNLFFPEIIHWHFGNEYHVDFIIPELPIKKDENNRSTNLDYFIICNSQKKGFLVELKTDKNSCDLTQMENYINVQTCGYKQIIDGIKDIYKATENPYRTKYKYLLDILEHEVNSEIQLNIIYILPESGIPKLKFRNTESKQTIHFITLESLGTMEKTSHLQEEWNIIRQSSLFQKEKP